jgi:hypothetical protein
MVPSTGSTKAPCVAWKRFQEQLPTVDLLRQWSREFTPERWGIVTGRLSRVVVTDFDGAEGRRQMREWHIEPHLRTGADGFHWYGVHPGWWVPTLNAKSSKNSWPWPGVDIRGDGGFAIALGRNSVGPYEQLRALVPEPFDILPAELRFFLRSHGQKNAGESRPITLRQFSSASGRGVTPGLLIERALWMAPKNGRNNSGMWLACQLRDNGHSFDEAALTFGGYRSRVAATNPKGLIEPYTESEMIATLREAYSRPARDPWTRRNPFPQGQRCVVETILQEPKSREIQDLRRPGEKHHEQSIADDPESLGLYVGHTGEPLVGQTGEPLSHPRFARTPIEVSTDRLLKPRDVRIYEVLALSCWNGGVSSLGKRLIARHACCAERLVIESLRSLEAAGHIQKQPRRHGQRGRYVLTSPVFAKRSRSGGAESVVSMPQRKNPRSAVIYRVASSRDFAAETPRNSPRAEKEAK